MEQDGTGKSIQQHVPIVPFLEPASLHCFEIKNLKNIEHVLLIIASRERTMEKFPHLQSLAGCIERDGRTLDKTHGQSGQHT